MAAAAKRLSAASFRRPGATSGILMGSGAILLWGWAATGVFLGSRLMGVWQFMGVAASLSGLLLLAIFAALGYRLRTLLWLPPRLWLAVTCGFVFYMPLYNTALLAAQTRTQVVGVTLVNYLWPTLAVIFTTLLVPGEQMRPRLLLALAMSLAGVSLANRHDIAAAGTGTLLPYLLVLVAAAMWALYCALGARWRGWARNYATTPLGFLSVGIIALLVCTWRSEWRPMEWRAWLTVILTALGPWAGGYALWELALHRVSGVTLGLMGALTPILSTVNLLILFSISDAQRASGMRIGELLTAATLITLAVVVDRIPSPRGTV